MLKICPRCHDSHSDTTVTCPRCKAYMAKHHLEDRESTLKHYSNGTLKCACIGCEEERYEFLTIDHINGRGSEKTKHSGHNLYRWLRRNNYPGGFRVLCQNCNHAYGHYGYCPHEKE